MSSSPPQKKLKSSEEDSASSSSWRAKSIEKFELQPVPGKKGLVDGGTEEAWKRYYMYRTEKEKDDARKKVGSDDDRYDSDGNSVSGDDDEEDTEKEGLRDIVWSWTDFGMDEMIPKLMVDGCKWQWTPQRPSLNWEEEDKLRSADYYSHVWSPYAIPHAIKLSHSWSGRVRWEGYDLATDWNYMLLDFEVDIENSTKKYTELCSNNYDKIKTTHLNKATCNKLREFLYGANTKQSKKVTCSDKDFLILIFGSMGSTDKNLEEDTKDCSLGYTWCPWKQDGMKERLFNEKAPADDDPSGEPPAALKGYNPRWCSWLRYRILEVTDSLGPISKYYQPPKQPSAKKPAASSAYGSYGDVGFGCGYGSDEHGDY